MSLWRRLLTFLSRSHAGLSSLISSARSITSTDNNNPEREKETMNPIGFDTGDNAPNMSEDTKETIFQVDEVVRQLQTLAIADSIMGDRYRVETIKTMIELYLSGKIDVTFDINGEPVARVVTYGMPLVSTPLFQSPNKVKKSIGYVLN